MDKEYVLMKLEERITELKSRYYDNCSSVTEVNKYSKAVERAALLKEWRLCSLVNELIECSKKDVLLLSMESSKGLEQLIEPCERHRRLRKVV